MSGALLKFRETSCWQHCSKMIFCFFPLMSSQLAWRELPLSRQEISHDFSGRTTALSSVLWCVGESQVRVHQFWVLEESETRKKHSLDLVQRILRFCLAWQLISEFPFCVHPTWALVSVVQMGSESDFVVDGHPCPCLGSKTWFPVTCSFLQQCHFPTFFHPFISPWSVSVSQPHG